MDYLTDAVAAQQWFDIQNQTFLTWCNHHLEKRQLHVEDISKDFSDGVKLIALIEVVTGQAFKSYVRNPKFPAHKMANITEALNFMEKKLGIKVVGCNARDIMDGNPKQCMGVIFLLINKIKVIEGAKAADEAHPAAPTPAASAETPKPASESATAPTPGSTTPATEESTAQTGSTGIGEATPELAGRVGSGGRQLKRVNSKWVKNSQGVYHNVVTEPTDEKSAPTEAKPAPSPAKVIVTPANDKAEPPSPESVGKTTKSGKRDNSPTPGEKRPRTGSKSSKTVDPEAAEGVKGKRGSGSTKRHSGSKDPEEADLAALAVSKDELFARIKPHESQIVRLQAYFRAANARSRWQTMHKSRVELIALINADSKIFKGIIRLQAVVRGRAVRDAQRKRRRRNEIAKEIASTEEKYVRGLQTAVDVYLKRLRACEEIPPTTIRTIFSEIEVIRSYNTVINAKLQARMAKWFSEGQKLGDIFLLMTDFLKVYTAYVNNYNLALKTLTELMQNPKIAKLLHEARQVPECTNLELGSFLIMPIQRIPRYVMLLTDLFKHTPNDHKDYEDLKKALQKMENVADYVNQKKREAENLIGVLIISRHISDMTNPNDLAQPHRRYVRQGPLSYAIAGKSLKPRYAFLFTDSIMFTTESTSIFQKLSRDKSMTSTIDLDTLRDSETQFKFRSIAYLIGAKISDVENNEKAKLFNVIELDIPPSVETGASLLIPPPTPDEAGTKLSISLPTPADKEAWLTDMDEMTMSLLEKKRSRLEIPAEEEKSQETAGLGSVSKPRVSISGKLLKRGQSGEWRERWCSLDGSILRYYKTKASMDQNEPPAHTMYLLFASVQLVGVMDRPHCFQILTKERIFYWTIPPGSEKPATERMNWVSSIREGIFQHIIENEKRLRPKGLNGSLPPGAAGSGTLTLIGAALGGGANASGSINSGSAPPSPVVPERENVHVAVEATNASGTASVSVEKSSKKGKGRSNTVAESNPGSSSSASAAAASSDSAKDKDKDSGKKRTLKKKHSVSRKKKEKLLVEKTGELTRFSTGGSDQQRKFKVVMKGKHINLYKHKKKSSTETIDLLLCRPITDGVSAKTVEDEQFFVFKLQTADRVHTFGAATQAEADDWVAKINQNVEELRPDNH